MPKIKSLIDKFERVSAGQTSPCGGARAGVPLRLLRKDSFFRRQSTFATPGTPKHYRQMAGALVRARDRSRPLVALTRAARASIHSFVCVPPPPTAADGAEPERRLLVRIVDVRRDDKCAAVALRRVRFARATLACARHGCVPPLRKIFEIKSLKSRN